MRKRPLIIGLISLLIITGLIIGVLISAFYNTQHTVSEGWMFKGAYATYQGKINSLSTSINLSATIQVIDLNATHVLIRTNSTISTTFLPTSTDQFDLWTAKMNVSFLPKSEILAETYQDRVAVDGIGTRNCTVYEYVNNPINVTYCIDNVFRFPVKLVYNTIFENQTYQLDFNLATTNINGL
jgi:hypothetical protein